jgi:hypothetical protein
MSENGNNYNEKNLGPSGSNEKNLGPSGSNVNTNSFDIRWKIALQNYYDNYMLYLTKKVRDNNTDNSLRQKVIDFNTEMKDIIEEVKTENENLIETIKRRQRLENNQLDCNKEKETNIGKLNVKTITLNKKIQNINEKLDITKHIIKVLYWICSIILIVNILIIYFIIKKK